METNTRTSSERETLAKLDELVPSLSPCNDFLYNNNLSEKNQYNEYDVDTDEAEMDEINDEIFALPNLSKVKYATTSDYGDPLVSPLSSLDIHDDDERNNKDMLQDFNNRDKKVQELILLNKKDFENIKNSFDSSEEEWKRLLRVLYAKSEIVPDREWFNTICEFINPTNPLLSKFKELVSNNLQSENLTNEECIIDLYSSIPYQTSEIDDDDGYSPYSPSYGSFTPGSSRRESRDDNNNIMRFRDVDIKVIRNYPEKLADFENVYPDFFMNAKTYFSQECRRFNVNHLQYNSSNNNDNNDNNNISEFINSDSFDSFADYGVSFDGNYNDDDFIDELKANVEEQRQACEDSELYDYFVQIFFTPRRMMPDDLWEEKIYECLNNWPHLMAQLKDIIAYEVFDKNINE